MPKLTLSNISNLTDEQRLAIIRRVMGPPHRTLEGDEREHILCLLALVGPYKETNNQHCWTEYYRLNDKEYHVTTFPGDGDSIIDEMLDEEF